MPNEPITLETLIAFREARDAHFRPSGPSNEQADLINRLASIDMLSTAIGIIESTQADLDECRTELKSRPYEFEVTMWREAMTAEYRGRKAREAGTPADTNPWYLPKEQWGIADLMECDPNYEAWEAGWKAEDKHLTTIDDLRRRMNREHAECVHCGGVFPSNDSDHWKVCESHPARIALDEARAALAEMQEDYEAMVRGRDQWRQEEFEATQRAERAEADNAALLQALRDIYSECFTFDDEPVVEEINGQWIVDRLMEILPLDHPGAPLLAEREAERRELAAWREDRCLASHPGELTLECPPPGCLWCQRRWVLEAARRVNGAVGSFLQHQQLDSRRMGWRDTNNDLIDRMRAAYDAATKVEGEVR